MGQVFNVTRDQCWGCDMSAAQITAQQIGGMAFSMMGTQQRIAHDDQTLRFNVRGTRKCNWIQVRLNGLDLYDVTFQKFSPSKYTVKDIHTESDVYCDQLHKTIEEFTGLYLSL